MAAALLLAVLQAAAAPPPAGARDVVVEGRRLPREAEVRHLAHAVAHQHGEQLARFAVPVCPEAGGLPPPLALRLARRLRADAADAGIPVAPEGCRPNLTVLVVADGRAVVRELRRTGSPLVSGLDDGELRRLVGDPGPTHAWAATELRSRDDDRLRLGSMKQDVPELQVREASIVTLSTRQTITGAVLLIDQAAAVGKGVDQMADYAAMRTLAQTRPAGAGGSADTILSLFDGPARADAPATLTDFDRGYLKALYRGTATDPGMLATSRIARAINREPARRPDAPAADATRR